GEKAGRDRAVPAGSSVRPAPAGDGAHEWPVAAGSYDVLVRGERVGSRLEPRRGLETVAITGTLQVLDVRRGEEWGAASLDHSLERPARRLEGIEHGLRRNVQVDGVVHVPDRVDLGEPHAMRRARRGRRR